MNTLKFFILLCLSANAFCNEFLFTPIPGVIIDVESAKVLLGKKLFNDPILSKDNSIACPHCHVLEKYGIDELPLSIGINGIKGKRNTPTIFNVRYNFVQTWDGHNKTLHEQVLYAIENKHEMAEKIVNVINKVEQTEYYKKAFIKLYPDNLTAHNIADAIEQYMKTLVTPYSRFDQYLRGDKEILSEDEIWGFNLFQSKGCVACHNGINLGSNLYQKLGIFNDSKAKQMGDYGRYLVTGKTKDKYFFKVPTLRNIDETGPYLHDGSIDSLHKVVKIMGEFQLGQQLDDADIDKIVIFLKTLTGKLPVKISNNQ